MTNAPCINGTIHLTVEANCEKYPDIKDLDGHRKRIDNNLRALSGFVNYIRDRTYIIRGSLITASTGLYVHFEELLSVHQKMSKNGANFAYTYTYTKDSKQYFRKSIPRNFCQNENQSSCKITVTICNCYNHFEVYKKRKDLRDNEKCLSRTIKFKKTENASNHFKFKNQMYAKKFDGCHKIEKR